MLRMCFTLCEDSMARLANAFEFSVCGSMAFPEEQFSHRLLNDLRCSAQANEIQHAPSTKKPASSVMRETEPSKLEKRTEASLGKTTAACLRFAICDSATPVQEPARRKAGSISKKMNNLRFIPKNLLQHLSAQMSDLSDSILPEKFVLGLPGLCRKVRRLARDLYHFVVVECRVDDLRGVCQKQMLHIGPHVRHQSGIVHHRDWLYQPFAEDESLLDFAVLQVRNHPQQSGTIFLPHLFIRSAEQRVSGRRVLREVDQVAPCGLLR